jgi:anti-sigma factor RsiW
MTDSHDRFDELVAAYALGAIDPVERSEFEVHLATCERCQRELAELSRTVGLGRRRARQSADALRRRRSPAPPHKRDPPFGDRARDDEARSAGRSCRETRARRERLRGVGGHLRVVAAKQVADCGRRADASQRERDLRASLAAARLDSARLRTRSRSSTRRICFASAQGSPAAPAAKGQAAGAARAVSSSAPNSFRPQPGRIYQLWMVMNGQPIGAGVFTPAAAGQTTVEGTLPANSPWPGTAITIAVTNEPGNGSATPTMPILWQGVEEPSS